jgi:hypothetical protein
MTPSADAFTRFSPWIAVGAALLYFLYDRLEVVGFLPLVAVCAALAAAGTLLRWVAAEQYALVDAFRYEVRNVLWPLMRDVMPVFTIVPVIAIAYAYRLRMSAATIAAFCTLPLAYLLYFDNGERFYFELFPFFALGVALIVARVWESDATAATARERVRHPTDGAIVMRQLLAAQRTRGPMLVFVRNPPFAEPLFIALSPLNFGRFPGRIVVARDLGRENVNLICRMPGRAVMIAESATRVHGPRLLPVQPDTAAVRICRAPALSTLTRIRG